MNRNEIPLLLAGVGPLPPEYPNRLFAPGLKIWGIARELSRVGHPVRLATLGFDSNERNSLNIFELGVQAPSEIENLKPRTVQIGDEAIHKILAREAAEYHARALIGSTDLMNRELALMDSDLPLWCAFFGDPMAEKQLLAKTHGSDDGLSPQWKMMIPALRRADRVSGCSRRQVGALMGELGTQGRLNRHTAEIVMAACLPPWIEPIPQSAESGPIMRGVSVPADAFIVLQTGGFNSWLDEETLFHSLEGAMANNPAIHFAATGGAIPGHNSLTFERFKSRVDSSTHGKRFHFLGWLPLPQVPRVIAEADLALNVDLPSLEGWLGTRNRLMDWLMGDLPIISTLGCEFAQDLGTKNLIRIVNQGDARAITDSILEIASNPKEAKARAEAARNVMLAHNTPAQCLKPLLDWAADPKPAPDRVAWKNGDSPPRLWLDAGDEAARIAELESVRVELARADAELKSLEGSRAVQFAMQLRKLLGNG